jgi:sec-independent protein translocase protein TatB
MFDIGFWELALIGVVALLVIGPERLPAVARTAGVWLGKARRMVASVKADVDRELKAEELKRIMKQQAESAGLDEIIEETRSIGKDVEKSAAEISESVTVRNETPSEQDSAKTLKDDTTESGDERAK